MLPACLAEREECSSLHHLEVAHMGQHKRMLFGAGMMSQCAQQHSVQQGSDFNAFLRLSLSIICYKTSIDNNYSL